MHSILPSLTLHGVERWHKYIHRNCFPTLDYFCWGFNLWFTQGKNRDCLPAITVRCLQLVGHFHPIVFCLIFFFFFLIFSLFCHVSWLISLPLFGPAVPRVVAVSPQMRLVEDNPSSLSLVEIYKQRCAKKGIEHDNPISRYYDRLATVQARGTQASHQV